MSCSYDNKPRGQQALSDALTNGTHVARYFNLSQEHAQLLAKTERVRIPQHYLDLIKDPQDPLGKQAIPQLEELYQSANNSEVDPLWEDHSQYSPSPHLTHRYSDRALLLVTTACPMLCRFCTRRRKTLSGDGHVKQSDIEQALAIIEQRPAIQEVILSGGDPLMLSDSRIEAILDRVKAIQHVKRIRLHTRMPGMSPLRITTATAKMLKSYAPIFIGLHFNHPLEIGEETEDSLRILHEAGLMLFSQTVLLRGVNNNLQTLQGLYRRIIECGVHPYAIYHPDLVSGTAHFRLSIAEGQSIVNQLRMAFPALVMLHYMVDTADGGGKVAL